jgi:hypothetical protein
MDEGQGVERAMHHSMSARKFTGKKGSCRSATDALPAPWGAVSSDCAGAKRYIVRVIRSALDIEGFFLSRLVLLSPVLMPCQRWQGWQEQRAYWTHGGGGPASLALVREKRACFCHLVYTHVPLGHASIRCVAVFIRAVPLLPGSVPWLHLSHILA